MTDQTGTPSSPEPPKLRRRLVTAAPAAAPKVKFVSPAAEGVEVVKPRFLTPELQAKLAQEQEEAARRAAEQAEADRIAAEKAAAGAGGLSSDRAHGRTLQRPGPHDP